MFSKRLKELRTKKKLSLRQLGTELGISYSSLSNYESGSQQPNFETLEKIANYFGVRLDYLTGKSDSATYNDFYHQENLRNFNTLFENASPIMQENFTMTLDLLFLILSDIMSSDQNSEMFSTLNDIMSDIHKVKVISNNLQFKSQYGTEYKTEFSNYLKLKNSLSLSFDKYIQLHMGSSEI